VWFVELRRAKRSVLIASGLGRPSADHLAAELEQFFATGSYANGGASE
jgi:hypothetical protein